MPGEFPRSTLKQQMAGPEAVPGPEPEPSFVAEYWPVAVLVLALAMLVALIRRGWKS